MKIIEYSNIEVVNGGYDAGGWGNFWSAVSIPSCAITGVIPNPISGSICLASGVMAAGNFAIALW